MHRQASRADTMDRSGRWDAAVVALCSPLRCGVAQSKYHVVPVICSLAVPVIAHQTGFLRVRVRMGRRNGLTVEGVCSRHRFTINYRELVFGVIVK